LRITSANLAIITIEKRSTDKYHSLCGINEYLNLSKQSPKYEESNTKDFGDEEETF
jgi:hypothetical protein